MAVLCTSSQLGPSVPGLVALVSGSGRDADYNNGEAQLSREYGGTGGEGFEGGAVPLYIAIGNVRLCFLCVKPTASLQVDNHQVSHV